MAQFLGLMLAPFIGLILWLFAAGVSVILMRMLPSSKFKSLLNLRLHPITVYIRHWRYSKSRVKRRGNPVIEQTL